MSDNSGNTEEWRVALLVDHVIDGTCERALELVTVRGEIALVVSHGDR